MSLHPHRRPHPGFSERQLRDALGEFATGVTIIATCPADGACTGFTANSFNSVSLDPPLVVWSLNRRASQLSAFERTEAYSVNVLTSRQQALAVRFATLRGNRFADVVFRRGTTGAPLIDGCGAWFECRHHSVTPAGDHLLFVGEVVHLEHAHANCGMLTFHRGRFGSTG